MRDDDKDQLPAVVENEAWIAYAKAKIARSLADPRPALSEEELDAELEAFFDQLYGPMTDAAA